MQSLKPVPTPVLVFSALNRRYPRSTLGFITGERLFMREDAEVSRGCFPTPVERGCDFPLPDPADPVSLLVQRDKMAVMAYLLSDLPPHPSFPLWETLPSLLERGSAARGSRRVSGTRPPRFQSSLPCDSR